METKHTINVYTDGANSWDNGNHGHAGLGVMIEMDGKYLCISKYIGMATNNIAELAAIGIALKALPVRNLPVLIFSDSAYAIGVLSDNKWKLKKNVGLILAIKRMLDKFENVRFVKVAGHSGIKGNEVADQLAKAGKEAGQQGRPELGSFTIPPTKQDVF